MQNFNFSTTIFNQIGKETTTKHGQNQPALKTIESQNSRSLGASMQMFDPQVKTHEIVRKLGTPSKCKHDNT